MKTYVVGIYYKSFLEALLMSTTFEEKYDKYQYIKDEKNKVSRENCYGVYTSRYRNINVSFLKMLILVSRLGMLTPPAHPDSSELCWAWHL